MKYILFILLGIVLTGTDKINENKVPVNWIIAGDRPYDYRMGIDKDNGFYGGNAACIQSISKKAKGFGTLMQQCLPGKFLGKKVRMSCMIKTENVKDWAGLWLRTDINDPYTVLGFDNMGDRPIKGSNDWKKYEIIMEIHPKCELINYGVLLSGSGKIWMDKFEFEILPDNEVKKENNNKPTLTEPSNLEFDN